MDDKTELEGLKELFAELDELNRDNENVVVAAVETCCDTGLIKQPY